MELTIEGTIIGGRVELDAPVNLPNGTRVRVELLDDALHPVPEPYDHQRELAYLRESLQDAAAGRGRDGREFLQDVAKKLNLPLKRGE